MEKRAMTDEDPQHRVTIARPFAVSKFEVTFERLGCLRRGRRLRTKGRAGDIDWGRGTRPVINVSWDDAQQYVAWLSKMTGKPYRLLSEAEWEYAARAGTQTAYSWGDEIGKNNANCVGCGSQWRQPVPGKPLRLARSPPTSSVSTTCTATSGSGSRIVITPTTTEHPTMVQRGLVAIATPASSAAVPGAAGLSTSARPSATGPLPMTGITPWASGSAGRLLFLEALTFHRALERPPVRRSFCLRRSILECPLLALSGHCASALHMSAFGGKADMAFALQMSAFDPKRTSPPFYAPRTGSITRPTAYPVVVS